MSHAGGIPELLFPVVVVRSESAERAASSECAHAECAAAGAGAECTRGLTERAVIERTGTRFERACVALEYSSAGRDAGAGRVTRAQACGR